MACYLSFHNGHSPNCFASFWFLAYFIGTNKKSRLMTEMTMQKEKANWWILLMDWVLGIFGHAKVKEEENQFLIE